MPVVTCRRRGNNAEQLWGYYKRRLETQKQDAAARNEIAIRHINLVRTLAHRIHHRCAEPYQDLEQIGMIGLLRAIDRFDPTKGVAFSSFAVPHIRGEMLHYLRDHGSGVKIPRRWREFAAAANKAERAWAAANRNKLPTEQELADYMGCKPAKLRQVRGAIANQKPASLDEMQIEADLVRIDPENSSQLETVWGQLRQQLGQLQPLDEQLIQALYFQRLSRREIAQQFNFNGEQLRCAIAHALEQLA